jgi:hypothetical protein
MRMIALPCGSVFVFRATRVAWQSEGIQPSGDRHGRVAYRSERGLEDATARMRGTIIAGS